MNHCLMGMPSKALLSCALPGKGGGLPPWGFYCLNIEHRLSMSNSDSYKVMNLVYEL